jgi:LuxR family transcriptional regulator, maltose regulon positive regulatory protein
MDLPSVIIGRPSIAAPLTERALPKAFPQTSRAVPGNKGTPRGPKRSALPAKLTRPSAGTLLSRERIFKRLGASAASRWVWIGAPAGAGKTSLASSWIETHRYDCLWVQLDAGDADPASFFHYLILVGLNRAGRKRVHLPALTPEFLPGLELYARRFFEQLFGLYRKPFVVVLDNCHEVPAEAPLFSVLLAALLDSLPMHGKLLCLSRTDLPAALTRPSMQPGFQQLRWEDLSLTDDEALELARRVGPAAVEVAAECNHRARGWITGVKLLLRTAPDELQRLNCHEELATQGLFDYYANEVFERVPAELRNFLLRAAMLSDLDAVTVAAVTERDDATTVLGQLYAERLFIERRMLPSGLAYGFHPLFRTYLQTRLTRALTAAQIAMIKTRAALSLEARGQLEAATVIALECDDAGLLVRLVLAQAPQLVSHGRLGTLEHWLRAVPESVRERDGWLLYWLGPPCAAHDLLRSRTCYEKAYHCFRDSGDMPGVWLACANLINSHFLGWGTQPERMWKWVEVFEILLADYGGIIPHALERQVLPLLHLMVSHCPEHPLSRYLVGRARLIAPHLLETDERCGIGAIAVGFLAWQGDEVSASALIDELTPGSMDDVRVSGATISFDVWRCTLLWCGSEHERCFSELRAASKRCRLAGLVAFEWLYSFHLAACALSAGDPTQAGQALNEGLRSLHPAQIDHRYVLQAAKAMQLALAGQRQAGATLARELLASESMMNAPSAAAFTRCFLAAALLEDDALDEAEHCALKILECAGRLPSDRWLFDGHMLLAGIELERSNEGAMLHRLRTALRLSSQRNFRGGVSLWQPNRTSKLLALALRHGIETDHVRCLIRSRKITAPTGTDIDALWPVRLRVHTLGRFTVVLNDQPLQVQSAGRKPLEVLKALIGLGAGDLSLASLGSTLWPELDSAAAHNACHVAIHRLRKLLGDESAIRVEHGTVTLNQTDAWVDVEIFRHLASRIRALLSVSARPVPEMQYLAEQLLGAYPGHFLPGEERAWTGGVREQLRARFTHLAIDLSGALERAGALQSAIALNRRAIELDPLAETFHRGLMRGLIALGHKAEALEAFRRCRSALLAGLRVEPSAETFALHARIRQP